MNMGSQAFLRSRCFSLLHIPVATFRHCLHFRQGQPCNRSRRKADVMPRREKGTTDMHASALRRHIAKDELRTRSGQQDCLPAWPYHLRSGAQLLPGSSCGGRSTGAASCTATAAALQDYAALRSILQFRACKPAHVIESPKQFELTFPPLAHSLLPQGLAPS